VSEGLTQDVGSDAVSLIAPALVIYAVVRVVTGHEAHYLNQGLLHGPESLLFALGNYRNLLFDVVRLLGAAVLIGLLDRVAWELGPARRPEGRRYPGGALRRALIRLRSLGLQSIVRRD
jgi:hypothetical protein